MTEPLTPPVVHRAPTGCASSVPCCGEQVFDLPRTDQMTVDGEVTCNRAVTEPLTDHQPIAYAALAASPPPAPAFDPERSRIAEWPWDMWCRICLIRPSSHRTEAEALDAADRHVVLQHAPAAEVHQLMSAGGMAELTRLRAELQQAREGRLEWSRIGDHPELANWADALVGADLTPHPAHAWCSTTTGYEVAMQVATTDQLTDTATTELLAELKEAFTATVCRVLGYTAPAAAGGSGGTDTKTTNTAPATTKER